MLRSRQWIVVRMWEFLSCTKQMCISACFSFSVTCTTSILCVAKVCFILGKFSMRCLCIALWHEWATVDFSSVWTLHVAWTIAEVIIDGSTNVKTSSFKDHASTEMHKKAMDLHKKSESNYSIQTMPIAQALHCIDSATLTTMKKCLI